MATSMAAALAASIPSAPSAPTPSAPTYEAIPASMSKVIDIEAEIPLTNVQLDGLVVSKIIKHSHDALPGVAHGYLLGLDLDGTLECSNSFAVPHHAGDDDEKTSKSSARYQASMLRSLKEIQADDSIVGLYQSTPLGAFYSHGLVDTQAVHQAKLRHGGVVVIHDASKTARGNASFRAFRLTPSFLAAHKMGEFHTQSLIQNGLTFSSIFEELPITIRTNPLLSAFVENLSQPTSQRPSSSALGSTPAPALPPSFAPLDFNSAGLARSLEHVIDAVDSYKTEEGNLAYLQRQIVREKGRAEAAIAKRKEENATRVAQGLAPLPEEEISRMFKTPQDPSRLDSMLLLGRIDAYAQSLEGLSSTSLVKMYATKAGSA